MASEEELVAIEHRMCACRDRACIEAAVDELDHLIVTAKRGADLGASLEACLRHGGPAVTELTAIRDRACACADAECAHGVQAEFTAFIERHKDTKGSREQADQVTKLAGELKSCVDKAIGGAAP